MNKFILGLFVIVAGGVVGWYFFQNTPKLPGMNIGIPKTNPTPLPTLAGGALPMTDESPVTGDTKGGVVAANEVSYTDGGFIPASVTVKKGTTVTFRNAGSIGMWVISGQHPTHQVLPGFNEKMSVAKGGSFTYTFDTVGTWQYHNEMKLTDLGTVTVTP